MRKALLVVFLFPIIALGYCPEQELGLLFRHVQMRQVFDDSKTFVDCKPKCLPGQILKIYREFQPHDLTSFVIEYFEVPKAFAFPDLHGLSMEAYIEKTWEDLVRFAGDSCCEISTLLPLPYPYTIPGARFREMYYWDSYFSMLGLILSGKSDLAYGMLANFAYLIDTYGFIPNGNRSYYLTRSQPPFFSLMVELTSCHKQFLPQLEKEYCFWMQNRSTSGGILNHYSDAACTPRPEEYRADVLWARSVSENKRAQFYHNIRSAAESGWDFSSRWLNERGELVANEIIPVDLNCLLYHEENLLAEICAREGYERKACIYKQRAAQRKQAIESTFWNEEKGYYFDYNFKEEKQTGHYTMAGVFPLFLKLASQHQAAMVVKILKEKFLKIGGLVTTLVESGEQWDYPNGWPPLQWIAIVGLLNYGYYDLADEIMGRWLKLNERHYEQTGRMFEKYDVVDPEKKARGGEYTLQVGFGWTNGVALYFLKHISPVIVDSI